MTQCNELVGFPNIGNSCYMDSVLFCLFSTPNAFIEKYLLKSRKSYFICNHSQDLIKELQKVFTEISNYFQNKNVKSNIDTCKPLKLMIQKYRKSCPELSQYPNFGNSSQQEALEFLQFLLAPFGLNGMKDVGNHLEFNKRYGISFSKKRVEWLPWFKQIDKKSSIICFVDHDNFRKPHKSLDNFIHKNNIVFDLENTKYKNCLVNTFEEHQSYAAFSELFIIAVDRINPFTGMVIHSRVKINLKLDSGLHLDSVIVHIGDTKSSGHYICFKKCNTGWVLYDDLQSSLRIFKSWKDVMKFKKGLVEKNGVLFFYHTK